MSRRTVDSENTEIEEIDITPTTEQDVFNQQLSEVSEINTETTTELKNNVVEQPKTTVSVVAPKKERKMNATQWAQLYPQEYPLVVKTIIALRKTEIHTATEWQEIYDNELKRKVRSIL